MKFPYTSIFRPGLLDRPAASRRFGEKLASKHYCVVYLCDKVLASHDQCTYWYCMSSKRITYLKYMLAWLSHKPDPFLQSKGRLTMYSMPCPAVLYGAVQSYCGILPHGTIHLVCPTMLLGDHSHFTIED